MIGTLIDCWRKKDRIVLWIKADGKNLRLEDSFAPRIYIKTKDIMEFRKRLYKNNIPSTITRKRSFFKKDIDVLEILVRDLSKYGSLVKKVEQLAGYNLEIFNADIKLEEYYFFDKNLFPLAIIEFEYYDDKILSIKAIDNADSSEYRIPDFTKCRMQILTKDNLLKAFDTRLLKIKFDNEILAGDEKDILLALKERFEKADPDLVFIDNGNLAIPFLRQKLGFYKIPFRFNRFEEDNFRRKEGSVIRSYAATVYRNESMHLKGRLHFDEHSYFTEDIKYYGILDGARACRIRIQRAEMRSSGACVTNLLMHKAYQANFLLPFKAGIYERFKTLDQLYKADRGAVIFEPRIGFHTDVVEFDFVSLYPNIMNKFNLSPETLFCRCCPKSKVPGLHYNYCRRERGIVSEVAKFLISRRMDYKKDGSEISRQKAAFLKWCLVTMFGYQAYKNRKIGIIETHESIQAYAREILLKAADTAELHGWEVIHGIIDSIYVKKENLEDIDIHRLGREIFYNTGMEINLEGRYKWIVFLPSINDNDKPVPGRFYGVFEDGELKCRGIDLRRSDSPQIVADMQTEMIDVLKNANDFDEFKSKFPQIFKILRNHTEMLPNASMEDLCISKSLSKIEYRNEIAQKAVISQMQEEGFKIQPGMRISYIIKDLANKNSGKRYVSLSNFDGNFDLEKYTQMLVKATFNLLQPFGVTIGYLYGKIKKTRQARLNEFAIQLNKEIEQEV